MDRSEKIIVVGASAGGMDAFTRLAAHLDPELPAAICFVIHTSGEPPTSFAATLTRNGPFTAVFPGDGESLQKGCIYLAQPDRHLVVSNGQVRLLHGPRENWNRPAIDPLFRSAAVHYRTRAVGLLLTGLLDDGTDGLQAIRRCGGRTVVQDPADAQFGDMPRHAVQKGYVDHIVPLAAMPELLMRLAQTPSSPDPPVPEELVREVSFTERGALAFEYPEFAWDQTALACPECGGPLWERKEGGGMFGCTVGHRFGPQSLMALQDQSIEQSLWTALRLLEERSTVQRRLAGEEARLGHAEQSRSYQNQAVESQVLAERLRDLLRRTRPFSR